MVRTLPASGASCIIGSQLDRSTGACCECCYSCFFSHFYVCVCLFLALQEQLGAAQGKVSRRCPLPPQQGDGSLLRPGAPAAAAAQRHLAPGQGLHHEAGHQLPAHAQAACHGYAQRAHIHTRLIFFSFFMLHSSVRVVTIKKILDRTASLTICFTAIRGDLSSE